MDSSGRSALREMRTMARLSLGILPLALLNDLTVGISLGFVWEEDGRLVGNVSVYPAKLPRSVGSSWIIANVGVHPLYQRRGIARKLMLRAMQMIRDKGAWVCLRADILDLQAKPVAAIPCVAVDRTAVHSPPPPQ